MAKIYAVKKGLNPGIYCSWNECKAQVDGYSGAEYKSFKDTQLSEAINYVGIEHIQIESTKLTQDNDKRMHKMLDNINPGFGPVHSITYSMDTLACAMLKHNMNIDPFAPKEGSIRGNRSEHMIKLDEVDIYVDGSFKHGNYSYGFVVVDAMGTIIHKGNGLGNNAGAAQMQSVAGELSAAMNAIDWAYKNNLKCIIYHDNKGIGEWATGSWKAKNQYTKQYVEFIKKYKDVILGFKWVKGHSGNKYNEIADRLASMAFNELPE